MTVSTHTGTISGSTSTHTGGTILNGGTIASTTPFVGKTPKEIVQGRKVSGSQVIANTGTANEVGITTANSNGKLAYNPSSPDITRSSTDAGFVMRGGVANNISSVSGLNPLFSGASDTTSRPNGNIHVPMYLPLQSNPPNYHHMPSDNILLDYLLHYLHILGL